MVLVPGVSLVPCVSLWISIVLMAFHKCPSLWRSSAYSASSPVSGLNALPWSAWWKNGVGHVLAASAWAAWLHLEHIGCVGWPPDRLLVVFDNLLLQQKAMSYILILLLILFLHWILISDFQMTCCSHSLQIFVSAVSLLIHTLYDYHHISILYLSTKYQVSTNSTWSISPVHWHTDFSLCDQLLSYHDSIDCIWLDHSTLWYWWHMDVHVPTWLCCWECLDCGW